MSSTSSHACDAMFHEQASCFPPSTFNDKSQAWKMKLSGPKLILHLEGLIVLVAACAGYAAFDASWGKFALLILAPDVFMLGYVWGTKSGARVYNLVHTYVAPFLLSLMAYFADWPSIYSICLIWVAHIGLDRLLGYGLKYNSDFKSTHLQRV
jgi:hypothetical protein